MLMFQALLRKKEVRDMTFLVEPKLTNNLSFAPCDLDTCGGDSCSNYCSCVGAACFMVC